MCSRFRCPLLKNGNSIRGVLSTCSATGVLHETLCALLARFEAAFGVGTRRDLLGWQISFAEEVFAVGRQVGSSRGCGLCSYEKVAHELDS
jgi:hypothetical protein